MSTTTKDVGTIVVNALIVVCVFGLVALRIATLGEALFGIAALLVPSAVPAIAQRLRSRLAAPAEPPSGPSVIEVEEKEEGDS
jgi:hypothetical protein